jgi:hypothetical protein
MRMQLWNCRGAATVPDWKDVIQGAGESKLLLLVKTHVLPFAELPAIAGYDIVVKLPRTKRFVDSHGQSCGFGGIVVLARL